MNNTKPLKKYKTEKEFAPIPETELQRKRNSQGEKFYNDYKYIKFLGEGTFSKVKLVCKNSQQYAMKVIDKKLLRNSNKGFSKDENGNLLISSMLEDALQEIAILKKCHHRNIIKLYEILHDEEKEKLYLILEYCPKGTLMIYDEDNDKFEINKNFYINKDFYENINDENLEIIEKEKNNITKDNYSEDEIRHFLRHIIKGVSYLHHNGIIHRDIKPDNILISNSNTIKITDFNVSSLLKDKKNDNIGKKIEGTLYFRAPETCILDENDQSLNLRGKPLDIWAIGVTAYILAYKQFPFYNNDNNMLGLFDIIAKGEYKIPNNRMSEGFIQFLKMCLEKDPNKRASIWKLRKMKWINEKGFYLDKEIFPPKICVSVSEVKGCIGFFNKIHIVSRVVSFYNKQSSMKNGNNKNLINQSNIINQVVYVQKVSSFKRSIGTKDGENYSKINIDKRELYKDNNGVFIKGICLDGEIGNNKLININNKNNEVHIKLNCECSIPKKMKKSSFDNLIKALNIIDEKYKKEYKSIDNKNNKTEEKLYKENQIPNIVSVLNKKIEEIANQNKK